MVLVRVHGSSNLGSTLREVSTRSLMIAKHAPDCQMFALILLSCIKECLIFLTPVIVSSASLYSEAGLEVHAIMPNGRIARDNSLSVRDRILRINGLSLIGIPFDKYVFNFRNFFQQQ